MGCSARSSHTCTFQPTSIQCWLQHQLQHCSNSPIRETRLLPVRRSIGCPDLAAARSNNFPPTGDAIIPAPPAAIIAAPIWPGPILYGCAVNCPGSSICADSMQAKPTVACSRCSTTCLSHTATRGAQTEPNRGGLARILGASFMVAASAGLRLAMILYWRVSFTSSAVAGRITPAANTSRAMKGACQPYASPKKPPAQKKGRAQGWSSGFGTVSKGFWVLNPTQCQMCITLLCMKGYCMLLLLLQRAAPSTTASCCCFTALKGN